MARMTYSAQVDLRFGDSAREPLVLASAPDPAI
jgi:hypothetical protein